MSPSLTICTPWWNHRELERDYWAAMRTADARVIVVDNGSDPPLPNAWRLDRNLGFSAACNIGLELARTDAVLFLNNDIAAFRPDWLTPLLGALEPGVLVGAELRFDPHGMVDGQAFPYLDGWCIAGMREDLLALGGFDEGFEEPAYYSDNDLCLRARADGMTLRAADVGLRHKLNATAGRSAEVTRVTLANRERFTRRARELMEVAA